MRAEERRAAGKKLREVAPLAAQGRWRADTGRANPIDILRAADVTRQPALVPLRYGRMLQSPFTFYRGSAAVMAEDLAPSPVSGVRVQACGDAHLMNFGLILRYSSSGSSDGFGSGWSVTTICFPCLRTLQLWPGCW